MNGARINLEGKYRSYFEFSTVSVELQPGTKSNIVGEILLCIKHKFLIRNIIQSIV